MDLLLADPEMNATKAYIGAGYKARGNAAESSASRLLRDVKVKAALSFAMAKRSERTQVTADRVLTELAKIGFANLTDVWRWGEGAAGLIPSGELSEDAAAAVGEVSIKTQHGPGEAGGVTVEHKVKMHPKVSALQKLGEHFGLFNGLGGGSDPMDTARKIKEAVRAMDDATDPLDEPA